MFRFRSSGIVRRTLPLLLWILTAAAAPGRVAAEPPAPVDELPLPAVPPTLRRPADRAAYLLEHFWDALSFGDTLRSRDRAFMEQHFSTFVSVFPHAGEPARRTAVRKLLERAEADTAAYVLLTEIAEKYLYETDSPLYSEADYQLFLEQFAEAPVLGEYGRVRPRWQLETVRKNRPGMTAADFAYTTRAGGRTTLHETPAGQSLLLIFYDPDCDHCREVLATLQQDPTLEQLTADGRLTVLAVYSGGDRALWRQTAAALPERWTVGYESGAMQERGAYVLRQLPTLYLLDRDKRVLLKEPRPEQLLRHFEAAE